MTDEKKELPVGTIESIDHGQIVLKVEIEGNEQILPAFKTTPKVDEFLSNPKYVKDYHKGTVVEFSAKNGTIHLIRKAGGFKKANDPQKEFAIAKPEPTPVKPDIPVKSQQELWEENIRKKKEADQKARDDAELTHAPPKETVGMYDPNKVKEFTVKIHINLQNYEYIEFGATGTEPEEVNRAVVYHSTLFGQTHEPTRELVQNAVKRALIRL